ncbi:MAG TPA: mannosyltransferase family protein [Baekduia sp.]|nr:mannosyltransferase family protein [Baekduia sp.]
MAWRAFAASRAVVWAAGLAAIAVWGVHAGHRVGFDPAGLTRPFGAIGDLLVAPAARYDTVWFLSIADGGYDRSDQAAFFPLYPALVRLLGWACGSTLLAAVVLSCAAFVAALAVVHRLAELEAGGDAARWAVWSLAFFPGALWFSAGYSESLFLLVSAGAVLAARQGRWAAAAALGVLATATRSAGLVLLVPLGLLWLDGLRAGRARRADVGWLVLVPAGLVAYCAVLPLFGLPADAPFSAQETWHRAFAGPWAGVRDGAVAAWDGARQLLHGSPTPVYFTAAGGDPMEVGRHNLMLFGFLVLAVPAVVGALRRLPLAYGAYAAAALLLPLSYPVGPQPLMSLPRFEAVLFPLFLWLGIVLARGPAWRGRLVLALFALGLAGASALFSTWHWVA